MPKTDELAQKCSIGNTNSRARLFCFTQYVDGPPKWNKLTMQYLGYGEEICPSTGRLHWQSWVAYHNPRTINSVSKDFNNSHVEIIRGTIEHNEKYCGKNDKFVSFGELPKQGTRTDLNVIKEQILNGYQVDDLIIESPMIFHQYGRTLNHLEDLYLRRKNRTTMTEGIWYHGATGCGKSMKAFENYHYTTHYVHNIRDKGWWDAYKQQETVIIDEFRGEISYNEVLALVDMHPLTVPRRNREPMPFTSKKVIITSSLHPREVFRQRNEKDSLKQLLRRFEIIELTPGDNRFENELKEDETSVECYFD